MTNGSSALVCGSRSRFNFSLDALSAANTPGRRLPQACAFFLCAEAVREHTRSPVSTTRFADSNLTFGTILVRSSLELRDEISPSTGYLHPGLVERFGSI